MYYFKLIFLLFLPLNILAQNSFPSQVKTIDLSQINQAERKLKLSDIAQSISYIQLSRNIPLAEINYIKPIDNGEFLIYCNSMVYRFDANGKYINSLFKSGRGPIDAVCYAEPAVDLSNRFVSINDNASSYYKMYNFEGKFLSKKEKKLNDMKYNIVGYHNSLEIAWLQKANWLSTPEKCNPFGEYFFTVTDLSSKKIVYQFKNPDANNYFKITGERFMMIPSYLFLSTANNKLWFNIRDKYEVYSTSDFKDVKQEYQIIPKKPNDDFMAMTRKSFSGDTGKSTRANFRIEDVMVTDRYVIIKFWEKLKLAIAYYDKKTGKTDGYSAIENDIDKIATFDIYKLSSTNSHSDNKLYVAIDALKIVDAGHASKFKGLNEDSNPVIMVVHLKK